MTSATCGPEAEATTRALGLDCDTVSPVASLRFPWDLANWTMPVLELLVVGGAVFALVHALRRHRSGDPVNLALWWASLVYLFVTEPPLYFPELFGLDEIYGFIFAHNQFTAQFMSDRLPFYIVAFYPMISQLAYELVRSLGIFRSRGALAGSVVVALACQIFYEVFDHVGPQLKWWAWNGENDMVNHPAMASVPMTSMLLFASVSMGGMTYLVVRLTGSTPSDSPAVNGSPSSSSEPNSSQRNAQPRRGWALVLRTVLAGVLTPLTMVIAYIPPSLFGGNTPNITGQAWILGIELALIWLAGSWVVLSHLRTAEHGPAEPLSSFARFYPAVYLGVMAVFWLAALPAYFGARDGMTSDATPIGSGLYAVACFVGGALLLTAMYRRDRTRGPAPASA